MQAQRRLGLPRFEHKLRIKESSKANAKNAGEHTDDAADSYTFNMAKNLDSPGLSELIYFTDAVRDKEDEGRKSDMPENHRAVDWLDFDGSYVHLQDAHQAEPETANPESKSWLSVPGPSMRRDSTPTNLMTSEWPMSEQDACTSPSIYSPEPEGDSKKARPLGLFEEFWRDHGGPQGIQMAVEDGEPASTSSNHLSESHSQWPESMGR